jgi:hypothetical protein
LVRQEGEFPQFWQDARLTMAHIRLVLKVCWQFLTHVTKPSTTIASEARPRPVFRDFWHSVNLKLNSENTAVWFSIVGAWS